MPDAKIFGEVKGTSIIFSLQADKGTQREKDYLGAMEMLHIAMKSNGVPHEVRKRNTPVGDMIDGITVDLANTNLEGEYGHTQAVSRLIMKHLDSRYEDKDVISELQKLVRGGHHSDCAMGAVPACTCGLREAELYLELVDRFFELDYERSRTHELS